MSWRYPDRRDGTVICVFADPQMGYRPWTAEHVERAGRDMDRLAPYCDGVVNVGDTIHWAPDGPEDGEALAFFRRRTIGPWSMVAGNHDLSSFVGSTNPHEGRTSKVWGERYNQEPCTVVRMGDMSIIGISPDVWQYTEPDGFGPMTLTEANVAWLDEALWREAPRPCWIACHIPLPEQDYEGHMIRPPSLNETLARHKHVVGWLSGHRHQPLSRTTQSEVLTFGSNQIIGINCPSTGGKTVGTDGDTPHDDTVTTTWITYRDGLCTIRWRDHLNERWTQAGDGFVRTHTRSV